MRKEKKIKQTEISYKVEFLNEYGRLVISSCINNKDKHNDSTVKVEGDNIIKALIKTWTD